MDSDAAGTRFKRLRVALAVLTILIGTGWSLGWRPSSFWPSWAGGEEVTDWDLRGALGELYDYYVDELVPCLAEKGYEVSGAPTREDFVEKPFAPDMWTPYTELDPQLSAEEEARLMEDCPQLPPPERLNDYQS